MYRTHTCAELRREHIGIQVTLAGWVQKSRDKGGRIWIDLRDGYGLTQLMFGEGVTEKILLERARKVGREFVLQAEGEVIEREAKNPNMLTGDIEIYVSKLTILNKSEVPPFLIEDETDGGQELRMQYRYLDLRRKPIRENLSLRHKILQATRSYLDGKDFMEVETPYLIKSTPEGARDFVVPSRMNEGQFYALPQSPQTFKQLLMVAGVDKYFQVVRCFRDEDLRADRQPEFTQVDCEMAFVDQEDVLQLFEGFIKHLYKELKGIELANFQRMSYDDAMRLYGSDKPDLRFGMKFKELNDLTQSNGFPAFNSAELVVGINVEGCAEYTRKQLDALTDFVRKPQIGAKGLVYLKYTTSGTCKSSVDKFFSPDDLKGWTERFNAQPGDLILIMFGDVGKTRKALGELRLEMGNQLGLRNEKEEKLMKVAPLWVVDFPLLEWDEATECYHATHHPFTSPKSEDVDKMDSNPRAVRANAYDLVINGVEAGGGSIRIHDRELQIKMFKLLGLSDEEISAKFGFLMDAFTYGAPPHGGIALGFDRLCAMLSGKESIRDFIAFPKNNNGRDVMIDSPSALSKEQLDELGLSLK